MKLQSVTPNLMVQDVNATIEFYTHILGFTLLQSVPETGSFDWAFMQSGDVQLMFQKEASLKEEYPQLDNYTGGGALTLYIRIEGVEELYKNTEGKVDLVKPLHKTFYGANEFAIIDPNGFILTFSEVEK